MVIATIVARMSPTKISVCSVTRFLSNELQMYIITSSLFCEGSRSTENEIFRAIDIIVETDV